MTLPAIIATIASFTFVAGLVWFFVSLVLAIIPRWRRHGFAGMKRSALLVVVAYVGTLMFNHAVIA